jgi:hypothetical protein
MITSTQNLKFNNNSSTANKKGRTTLLKTKKTAK